MFQRTVSLDLEAIREVAGRISNVKQRLVCRGHDSVRSINAFIHDGLCQGTIDVPDFLVLGVGEITGVAKHNQVVARLTVEYRLRITLFVERNNFVASGRIEHFFITEHQPGSAVRVVTPDRDFAIS